MMFFFPLVKHLLGKVYTARFSLIFDSHCHIISILIAAYVFESDVFNKKNAPHLV